MTSYKTIALIGATGKAGKYILNALIPQGFTVKVLLRTPEKLEVNHPLVEKITGNVKDYETILNLLQGCDAVISALGQSKGDEPAFSQAAANIIRAMTALNIQRYIVITGLTLDAADDKKSFRTKLLSRLMKLSFPATIADKQQEYALLLQSHLDWTVVRLPMIEQTSSLGVVKVSLTDCPGKKISTTDLATFLIGQLSDERFIRRAPFIAN